MVRQLLINLITVVVAVFLIAVVAHQFYYRYSPYEECMRDVDDGYGSFKFGILGAAKHQEGWADILEYRDYVARECAQKTHW
jgi:hypothetical protein